MPLRKAQIFLISGMIQDLFVLYYFVFCLLDTSKNLVGNLHYAPQF